MAGPLLLRHFWKTLHLTTRDNLSTHGLILIFPAPTMVGKGSLGFAEEPMALGLKHSLNTLLRNMISFLSGNILSIQKDSVVVETSCGVGYEVILTQAHKSEYSVQ